MGGGAFTLISGTFFVVVVGGGDVGVMEMLPRKNVLKFEVLKLLEIH